MSDCSANRIAKPGGFSPRHAPEGVGPRPAGERQTFFESIDRSSQRIIRDDVCTDLAASLDPPRPCAGHMNGGGGASVTCTEPGGGGSKDNGGRRWRAHLLQKALLQQADVISKGAHIIKFI